MKIDEFGKVIAEVLQVDDEDAMDVSAAEARAAVSYTDDDINDDVQ